VRRLIWTDAARADLDGIAEYHAKSDKRIGELVLGRIEEAAVKLARRDTGRPGRIGGTREKTVAKTRHLLVYEVYDNLLIVFRVVHTARDWP
jgi:plasmid stabilization system protein ParE